MEPSVFQFLGGTVTNATDAFVGPAAGSVMALLKGIVVLCVTLYLTVTGYMIMVGSLQSPFWSFVKLCARVLIISAFALSIDNYTSSVMGSITNLELSLADALSVGTDPASIYQVLDQTLGEGMDIILQCLRMAADAGWRHPGSVLSWFFAGFLVALGTVILMLLGGVIVILAKFAIAVLFAVGPLFIFSLMFPITSKFFDSWIAQVLNYTLLVVIAAVILSFAMAAYSGFLGGTDFSGDGVSHPIAEALQILVVTAFLGIVLWQSRLIASGLAGGMTLAALSLRDLRSPASAARNLVDPRSTRRDLESGMMTTARRMNHMVAGNSMLNPAYRQHVGQNFMRNWGSAKGGKVEK